VVVAVALGRGVSVGETVALGTIEAVAVGGENVAVSDSVLVSVGGTGVAVGSGGAANAHAPNARINHAAKNNERMNRTR